MVGLYKLTSETIPGAEYAAVAAGTRALRVVTPANGATVPAVFSVDGTAPPSSTVELWHRTLPNGADAQTGGTETPAVATADVDGVFRFEGSGAMTAGRHYEIFVKIGAEYSPRVTVFVVKYP